MYWQQYGITPEVLELYKVCSTGFSEHNGGWDTVHLYFICDRTDVWI